MSYYAGNVPPPEKMGMFPPGSYPPSGGSYLPAQSGLPPGATPANYPAMAQQYASVSPYPPSSAYGSSGYPGSTHSSQAAAYQAMGYPSAAPLAAPTYVTTQGYSPNPSAGYPSTGLATQSPYGSAPVPGSNPLYQSAAAYPGMPGMPAAAGRGYPSAPMYPSSNYPGPFPGHSPYGPPF